jgi:hypothetical protein
VVTSVRARLHSMNAEKIAEQKRLENAARYSAWNWGRYADPDFATINDAEFYTELPPTIGVDMFVGDSTDIFDADSDDIASYIAMFFPTYTYD